ncbi:MAG: polymer-forming cytoskeletal protein [Xanthomarina sp.]
MTLKKIKAGALQSTLFISVVIAILLTVFILLIQLHKRFDIQTKFIQETVENGNYGINYTLHNHVQLQDSLSVILNEEAYKSLKIYRDYWGVFEKVTSVSKIKANRIEKVAFIGGAQPLTNRLALYLEDNNKPLVLVGNTKIAGVAYLPEQGVKSGNIAGHSYYGTDLIYGQERTSQMLPKLLSELYSSMENVNLENNKQFIDLNKDRNISNSFLSPVKTIFSPNSIHLSQIKLTGHIQVVSETKIIVEASSHLTDVVLIAPEIEIQNGVHGIFQSLATKKITVGENCKLSYPSALIIKNKKILYSPEIESQNSHSDMRIGENSVIKGLVIYYGESIDNNYKAQLIIEEDAVVQGQVYCNLNLELKGTVQGSVFASHFIANRAGSIYQNHIYNGHILIDDLPKQYVGLTFDDSRKRVMKWLY